MADLWEQVRRRGNLPGFSNAVRTIVAAMHGEPDCEFNMTRAVLADPVLTQRVLRLANSPMYSVFGQDINTVSKAVIVLGTEPIGHLALGLKLIDSLSEASAEAIDTRGEMEKALLSGHIARQVATAATLRDGEEAVVCSMLHCLGRMMVAFYLPQAWQTIQTLVIEGQQGPSGLQGEDEAASACLGMRFNDIARAVAQEWGLPTPLIETLQDVSPDTVTAPLDHAGWLAAVSTLSTHCAALAWGEGGNEADIGKATARLSSDYAAMLGLAPQTLMDAVQTGRENALSDAATQQDPTSAAQPPLTTLPILPGKPVDAAQRLTRGVADIRGAATSANTAQLLAMALETVFQGLGFNRAIAFVRDAAAGTYVPRLCLGEHIAIPMPQLMFVDTYQPDIFHAALANDKMVFIDNAQDTKFSDRLPHWWKTAFPSTRSLMVLPLVIKGRAVGLIYGDWDTSAPQAKIDESEIIPLDTLRILMVRSLELRQ